MTVSKGRKLSAVSGKFRDENGAFFGGPRQTGAAMGLTSKLEKTRGGKKIKRKNKKKIKK